MMGTTSEPPQKFGDAGLAMQRLRASLEVGRTGGVTIQDPAILTFAALRVVGPAGSVLVSAGYQADGKLMFFAPPIEEVEVNGVNVVIGTSDHITEVAGILRSRVTVAA